MEVCSVNVFKERGVVCACVVGVCEVRGQRSEGGAAGSSHPAALTNGPNTEGSPSAQSHWQTITFKVSPSLCFSLLLSLFLSLPRSLAPSVFLSRIKYDMCYMHGSMHEHEREFHTHSYNQ